MIGIGPHVQIPVPGWDQPVRKLPHGTYVKSVNDQGTLLVARAANPGVRTLLRKHYDDGPSPTHDYETNKQLARDFLDTFVDGTFIAHNAPHINTIEGRNENIGNSTKPEDLQRWLSWTQALCWVWEHEYKYAHGDILQHIDLALVNIGIGNDIPWQFAQVAYDHGNCLSYHAYTNTHKKQITESDARWYSGRWRYMDAEYRTRGIYVDWIFSEGGPFIHGTVDGHYYQGVYDGWQKKACLDGDIDAFVNIIVPYNLNMMNSWHDVYGRCRGMVYFTTDTDDKWEDFKLNADHWHRIADAIATHQHQPIENPPPIPSPVPQPAPDPQPDPQPAPVPDPHPDDRPIIPQAILKKAWDETERKHIEEGIHFNTAAALLSAIIDKKTYPVTNEAYIDGWVFQRAQDPFTGQVELFAYDPQTGNVYTATEADTQL